MLIPPYILALEFKSKEELQLMPQTMEEHLDELDSQYSDSDNMSLSSFDDDQVRGQLGCCACSSTTSLSHFLSTCNLVMKGTEQILHLFSSPEHKVLSELL